MGIADEVRYRLRLPLDAYAAVRYTVRNYFTRDQPLGHGLMTLQMEPRFYYHRGPWWVKPVVDLLDAADVLTGHQFCSRNIDVQRRLMDRFATTTTIDLDPVQVRYWRDFVSGPDDEEVEFGPFAPSNNVVANDPVWLDVLGAHWFCTGCGDLVGRRRPEDHGVCIDCGTAMLPRGFYEDDEPVEVVIAAFEAGDKQLTSPPLSDALTELTEYELAREPEPDAYYCAEHDRYLPCRPCMREETG